MHPDHHIVPSESTPEPDRDSALFNMIDRPIDKRIL